MSIGWVQIIIVVALLILLFGRGRISSLMGDVAKGIKSFRSGLRDEQQDKPQEKLKSVGKAKKSKAKQAKPKRRT